MNELTARTRAANALARYDTAAVVDAALAMDNEEFLIATSTFIPPEAPLSIRELEVAAERTTAAIAMLEARAGEVGNEIAHLLQGNAPTPRETGTRVDFAG